MKKQLFLIFGIAAGLLLATGPATADDDKSIDYYWYDGGNSLQGSWLVETTVRVHAEDCTTAAPVPGNAPNPFPAFNSFHQGGTMTEQGSRSSPGRRSTGFGVWERTGHRKYAYRLQFHSFDVNGLLTATMDIRTQLKLARDGETFEGVSRFVRTDISGNALKICATMTGERINL
jgi:hypothetical protein